MSPRPYREIHNQQFRDWKSAREIQPACSRSTLASIPVPELCILISAKDEAVPVPETAPFRARPQRAPSACTSVMKSQCCTLQNYPNPNIHTVILSVARGLHVTALTFAMKLLWVSHFRGDRVHFGHETASGLRWSATVKRSGRP